MPGDQSKDGVSVKEIENFAKKHRFELFLCLSFLLACFFSFVFFAAWSLILAAVGGVLGVLTANKVEAIFKKATQFCMKQEQATQLILGIAGLILSIFLPLITFLVLGAAGGKYLQDLKNSIIDL